MERVERVERVEREKEKMQKRLSVAAVFFLCNVFDTFIMRIPYAYVDYSLSSLDWILFENLCLATSGLM